MRNKRTDEEFLDIIAECKALYAAKMKDYAPAWRVLRLPSLTDQLLIKVSRIRTLQIEKEQKVKDDVRGEFIGIVNYAVIALIQLECGVAEQVDMDAEIALNKYDEHTKKALELMNDKNHDYGEAWRNMRVSSITDIILMKIMRVKQIEDNDGKTIVSEGLEANYMDMLNYAVFALILMK